MPTQGSSEDDERSLEGIMGVSTVCGGGASLVPGLFELQISGSTSIGVVYVCLFDWGLFIPILGSC